MFIFGLIIGSFLNVCIYRIPRNESISFPPSHCTSCNSRIKWYDLIPVLSYIFLKGKCRNCGKKISIRYPIIELITGALFAALYIKYGMTFEFVKYAFMTSCLLVIGMIDYDTTDVYLKTTLTGIISGTAFAAYGWYSGYGIMSFLLGAALGFGFIAAIILITHGMGWGDAEICLLCGVYLGFKLTAIMLLASFIIGGITGIILIITKKKSRKDYIPFGPFISVAALFTVFFGQSLLSWYLNLL